MSEEEIIKEVESAIWFMKEDNYNVNALGKAIQGLLDLYNIQRKMLNDAFDRGWIHKDKIREIIYPTPTNPISYEIQTSDMYRKILQLLEEE